MKIIALRGGHDTGKTSTLRFLIDNLIKANKDYKQKCCGKLKSRGTKFVSVECGTLIGEWPDHSDFFSVFEIGELIIGIITCGDAADDIVKSVSLMKQVSRVSNFDILCCAVRSYGETVATVAKWPEIEYAIFCEKAIEVKESKQKQSNQTQAVVLRNILEDIAGL